MNKADFYRLALKSFAFRAVDWVNSVFCEISNEETFPTPLYPFFIHKDVENKIYFYKPHTPDSTVYDRPEGYGAGEGEWVLVDDYPGEGALFHMYERLTIGPEDFMNVKASIETTYARAFFNSIAVIYPLGTKSKMIPFKNDIIDIAQIEDVIASRLVSMPDDDNEPRDENLIYIDEMLRFKNTAMELTNFNPIFVPSLSEKAIVTPPGTRELRDQLFAEAGDKLGDPAVMAQIEDRVIEHMKAYFKGDPAEVLINTSAKSYKIVLKKLYIMLGSEEGLIEGEYTKPILKSLSEGWDIKSMPTMNTLTRSGSFKRGAQTAFGGELVKWLFRLASNVRVIDGDCGSTMGVRQVLPPGAKANKYIGNSIVTESGPLLLTSENIAQYAGKAVIRRSTQYCQLTHTDYCTVCCGERLADNKTGASAAIANIGSIFQGIFMKAMHGKAMATKRVSFKETIF